MLREDPLTGDLRLVAPGRAASLRPSGAKGCPFCAGNELQTPEETGSRPRREQTPTDAAWAARSFPNRFPLTSPHEVVVPTPRHATSWRDLTLPELQDGLSLLLERRAAHVTDDRYVHAFVNDGTGAGASLPHVHAQVVVLDRSIHTDRLVHGVRTTSTCALCALLGEADLVVEQGMHHSIVAHPVPRLAGALLVVPRTHSTAPSPAHLAELAELLRRAQAALPDGVDMNMWFVIDEAPCAHWYLELQPRSANLAGVELALGLSVSAASARDTAEEARERLAMQHR